MIREIHRPLARVIRAMHGFPIDWNERTSPPSPTGSGPPLVLPGAVLIVDDDPSVVEMLAFLFEDEGYPVCRAFDGEQALWIARRERPVLVISDITLPKLNGVELARRLRIEHQGEMPAILMSAAVREHPGEGVAFVPKPFDPFQMLSLALRHLAAGNGQRRR
ncbi:MAG: response regulator [Thermomicrobiales bacterium]